MPNGAFKHWSGEQRLRWTRAVFIIALPLIFLWGLANNIYWPDAYDPWLLRGAVEAFVFVALLATFFVPWAKRGGHLYLLRSVYIVVTFYAFILPYENYLDAHFLGGCWIVVMGVTSLLHTTGFFLVYWGFVLFLAAALLAGLQGEVSDRAVSSFLVGLASVMGIGLITFFVRRNLLRENYIVNERFGALVEHSPLGIFLSNPDGSLSYVNPRWRQIFDISERTPSEEWLRRIPERERVAIAAEWRESFGGNREWVFECSVKTSDTVRWIRVLNAPWVGPTGEARGQIGTVEDLTELRRAQDRALAATKMSALGSMASNLAHEMATPLTVILGRTDELLGDEEPGDGRRRKALEQILRTGRRLEEIVRGLSRLSRDASRDGFEQAPLQRIVADTIEIARGRALNQGIQLETSAIPTGVIVHCRPTEISQVVLNLLNNAFDAVQGRPSKRVEVVFEDLSERYRLKVRDNGSGVAPENIGRLFEPFFTTKEPGRGVGLGLSISREILGRHGGRLEFERQGEWTVFSLDLPKLHSLSRGVT